MPDIYRGDTWPGMQATVGYAGQDFTDVTGLVSFRKNPNSAALLSFIPTITVPALGQVYIAFSLTGAQTATLLEGALFGDVELSRSLPLVPFGPKTWLRFQTNVLGDYAYA
jgi:hypothetical protein